MVVEVGPGLGSLTLALLEVAARVVAIEVDAAARRAAAGDHRGVRARSRRTASRWCSADAMRIDAVPGPPPTALVANLPYNVSVPVLLHMLALLPSLERGLVMVQAEVADRLAAAPGSKVYGVPSVKAAWFADVRRAGAIGRNVFWPAPNVDSGLVAWTRREPPATTATREQVFAVVDAAFAHRRKALRGALRGLAGSAEAATPRSSTPGSTRWRAASRWRSTDFVRIAEGLAAGPGAGGTRVSGAGHGPRARQDQPAPRRRRRPREDGYPPAADRLPGGRPVRRPQRDPGARLAGRTDVEDYIDPVAVPLDGDNIVDRAATLLAAHHGVARSGDLQITKAIPVAGGMAGGSAECAAAALVALDRLWRLDTSDTPLRRAVLRVLGDGSASFAVESS